ncbi:MAG TPA: DUF4399 domain-containing protein [Geminicoccaceae bacterium]|nr:DUF4399 domain-containing protein [Geminicoccaceae bacterium]
MTRLCAALLLGSALAAPVALAGDTPAPADAYLYIGWPNDGEAIDARRFRVWFGLRHMGVAPAEVDKPNTGHHHLLVDTPVPPSDQPIPNDRNHLHFGGGQTETTIELPPGTHTLQLIMGDKDHIPHNPPVVSKQVTITVR